MVDVESVNRNDAQQLNYCSIWVQVEQLPLRWSIYFSPKKKYNKLRESKMQTHRFQSDQFRWYTQHCIEITNRFKPNGFDQLTYILVEHLCVDTMWKQRLEWVSLVSFFLSQRIAYLHVTIISILIYQVTSLEFVSHVAWWPLDNNTMQIIVAVHLNHHRMHTVSIFVCLVLVFRQQLSAFRIEIVVGSRSLFDHKIVRG